MTHRPVGGIVEDTAMPSTATTNSFPHRLARLRDGTTVLQGASIGAAAQKAIELRPATQ
jgi:hypothetical protein